MFQEVAVLTVNQVGAGRTRERSQCEMKRLSEGAAVEGFKTALRVAEASGTANGRTNTALPVADEAVLVRALKKGEIEQKSFLRRYRLFFNSGAAVAYHLK